MENRKKNKLSVWLQMWLQTKTPESQACVLEHWRTFTFGLSCYLTHLDLKLFCTPRTSMIPGYLATLASSHQERYWQNASRFLNLSMPLVIFPKKEEIFTFENCFHFRNQYGNSPVETCSLLLFIQCPYNSPSCLSWNQGSNSNPTL